VIIEAIDEYRAAIGAAWHDLTVGRAITSDVEIGDASRYLAALTEGALRFVHADPARPSFVPWVTAERRWADNGSDSAYWYAPVDGAHRYRVHGERRDECYLSVTVYAGTPAHPEHVVANFNHVALGAEQGEPFSIEIDPPEDACYVIVRQYFHDPVNDRPATLHIDVVDGPAPQPPDAATIAEQWRVAADFVRTMARPPVSTGSISYASQVVNQIGTPSGWQESEGGGRGTPDQTYALGRFHLAPHEALVMDLRMPACVYASVVLWNQFGQTIDSRLHATTLNHHQVARRENGTVRVVASSTDPGVPNWLDTGGRERGTIFWRFLLASERPEPITSRVLDVADVRGLP
jgi:hypothetical protein